MAEIYVGAKKVGCNKCIFCRQCLFNKEILFTTESQITLSDAIKDDIRCSSCNSKLYTEEQAKAASATETSTN